MGLEVLPLHESFVAEVTGIAPTLDVNDAIFKEIERAFYTHSILVFRDLNMSPEQHIAFTRRFESESWRRKLGAEQARPDAARHSSSSARSVFRLRAVPASAAGTRNLLDP